jgi:hypothetical protein
MSSRLKRDSQRDEWMDVTRASDGRKQYITRPHPSIIFPIPASIYSSARAPLHLIAVHHYLGDTSNFHKRVRTEAGSSLLASKVGNVTRTAASRIGSIRRGDAK